MATTVAVANKHRALIDAEYALNSDGGGGTLDDDTGKPLFFGLQTAEKTYADFTLTTRNPGGHSSHAARRQRHLRSRRGAREAAAVQLPGDVERHHRRQLPRRRQDHAG